MFLDRTAIGSALFKSKKTAIIKAENALKARDNWGNEKKGKVERELVRDNLDAGY